MAVMAVSDNETKKEASRAQASYRRLNMNCGENMERNGGRKRRVRKGRLELHTAGSCQRRCSSIQALRLIAAQRCPVWPALSPA